MQDTAKYLIHANITADGIVERSDVVGAVFGQTEGLLGDDLDLRDLQDSSKVGRIDVDIDSANGQSFGEITIATSLDKVETAILGAALETIDRVGPCRSTVEVDRIEDVRAAKRREVIERAKGLLADSFDGSFRSSDDLVNEVRRAVRVEDVSDYEGLPAGPRVGESDAIIVVEGRADVTTLLEYGVKNAVAVEGTDVPDAIAELTREHTTTAFLDGDRGGELILRELAQVGDVDHVAFAPEGRSVEDLDRHEVMAALRGKVPYDSIADESDPRRVATDDRPPRGATDGDGGDGGTREAREHGRHEPGDAAGTADATGEAGPAPEDGDGTGDGDTPETLRGHARAIIERSTGRVRLLDAGFGTLAEAEAEEAFDLVRDAEGSPTAVVLDGEATQRLLDVAAQRGVDQIVAGTAGEFVKRPTDVRVRTADRLFGDEEAPASADA